MKFIAAFGIGLVIVSWACRAAGSGHDNVVFAFALALNLPSHVLAELIEPMGFYREGYVQEYVLRSYAVWFAASVAQWFVYLYFFRWLVRGGLSARLMLASSSIVILGGGVRVYLVASKCMVDPFVPCMLSNMIAALFGFVFLGAAMSLPALSRIRRESSN